MLLLILMTPGSFALAQPEQRRHDIFFRGELAPGVVLSNAEVRGKEIRTASLGEASWGQPAFELRGLDIDISGLDLAQVHVRIVAEGDSSNKPSYADVGVLTSKPPGFTITQFPFRSYRKKDPDYMMRSADHSPSYARRRAGDDYGSITGLAIKTSGGFSMRISSIQVLIDTAKPDQYPDDPSPDPQWRHGSVARVFAIPVSERVFLNELDSALIESNAVWQGRRITLQGAANETVAFQLIIQAAGGADGLNDVDVKFNGVANGSARIDNAGLANPADPYDYVGRSIQLYRSRYVYYDHHGQHGGSPRAAQTVGKYIPEIQIPFEAKWGGAPFSIFPGQTQAVWVDIYIPRGTPAGDYSGEIEVLVGGEAVSQLPVELQVHDFELPNRPSRLGLMFADVPGKHGARTAAKKLALEKTYRQFFRRHHGGMFRGVKNPDDLTPQQWRLRGGDIYTPAEGYQGPGEGLPTQYLFLKMYGGGLKPFGGSGVSGSEADWHRGLLEYKRMADRYAPDALLAYYVWDEPGHAFKGGLEAFIPWFNTQVAPRVASFNAKYGAEVKLYASVDAKDVGAMPAMDIYRAETRDEALRMEREGDINCSWNGPQGLGHFASALRVVGWKAFYNRTSFWWMWHATAYPDGFDVYRDPYNFRSPYGEEGAGVGMFVYPGTDIYVDKRSPGLAGPVPGSRFLNWRQGFVDAQYLELAAERDPSATLAIAAKMVSGAKLNSGLPGEKASIGYPVGEAHYAAARRQLVDIILSGRGSVREVAKTDPGKEAAGRVDHGLLRRPGFGNNQVK